MHLLFHKSLYDFIVPPILCVWSLICRPHKIGVYHIFRSYTWNLRHLHLSSLKVYYMQGLFSAITRRGELILSFLFVNFKAYYIHQLLTFATCLGIRGLSVLLGCFLRNLSDCYYSLRVSILKRNTWRAFSVRALLRALFLKVMAAP